MFPLKPACSYEIFTRTCFWKQIFNHLYTQKNLLFPLFLPKGIRDIANDRLVANEESQLESFENNVSSPQNKQITGRCIHLWKCFSVYEDVLKLDQRIVRILVPIIRQRSSHFLLLLNEVCKDCKNNPVKLCLYCNEYLGNTSLNEKKGGKRKKTLWHRPKAKVITLNFSPSENY